MHINGIRLHTRDTREQGTTGIRGGKVVVDSRKTGFNEAVDLIMPIAEKVIASDHILGSQVEGSEDNEQNHIERNRQVL
jgi:hypothetical protein